MLAPISAPHVDRHAANDDVLVFANTATLKSAVRRLLVLVRRELCAQGHKVDLRVSPRLWEQRHSSRFGALATPIVNGRMHDLTLHFMGEAGAMLTLNYVGTRGGDGIYRIPNDRGAETVFALIAGIKPDAVVHSNWQELVNVAGSSVHQSRPAPGAGSIGAVSAVAREMLSSVNVRRPALDSIVEAGILKIAAE